MIIQVQKTSPLLFEEKQRQPRPRGQRSGSPWTGEEDSQVEEGLQ